MSRLVTFLGDFAPFGEPVQAALPHWRPFQFVRNTLGEDIRLIANLEAPLTSETNGRPFKWANLRADPAVVSVLQGLDVAVLANNHISDFGAAGVRETLGQLDRQEIKHVGYGKDLAAAVEPLFVPIGDGKLGLLAFCCPTTNGENLATHWSEGVAPLGMEVIRRAVQGARSRCDALVVYLHWGCEWVHDPVPDQMRLARHAIDCGADAVVGCHSHTIQSYEQYQGRWIFYGLGNFFFGQGFRTEVMADGTIRRHQRRFAPANRESLAPSFSFQSEKGQGRLNLHSLHCFRFNDNLTIEAIQEEELSFKMSTHKAKLATFVQNNEQALKQREELEFRSKFRNGILAYWYADELIGENKPLSIRRKFLQRAKPIAKAILPSPIYNAAADLRRSWRLRLKARLLDARIRLKWMADRRRLPLSEEHWELYQIIHRRMLGELGEFPNLVNPRDFNDRIQWLKLFDQTEEHVGCTDKIGVREYVRERVGEQYLAGLYQVCERFEEIDFEDLPKSFVIKTNHDSGGVCLVRDKNNFDKEAARNLISNNLRQTYGWENGEWAYAFIRPRILVEEFIRPDGPGAPPDFKFHCVDGQIKWLQYIYDRGNGTKETIVSPAGEPLRIHFSHNMEHSTQFAKPSNWNELCAVAEKLSNGWKYVRIDLFSDSSRIIAGEMTFFPLYGCYKSKGQVSLGKLMTFDLTSTRKPLTNSLSRSVSRELATYT